MKDLAGYKSSKPNGDGFQAISKKGEEAMSLFSAVVCSLVLVCTLTFCSCGGARTTNLAPRPTSEIIQASPDWFLKPPADSEHLFATATATSRDMQLALQKARTAAQADLSQQLGTRMASLTKQFQEETGQEEDSELLSEFSSATKAVTNETLVGATVDRQKLVSEKGIFRAYVLMNLPIGGANRLLVDKIKANQNLYSRFRATEAFDALNRELDSLEAEEGK